MDFNERVNVLRKQVEQFGKMPDADWELLTPSLKELAIPKHGFLTPEGKHGKDIGVIIDGSMRHYYTRDGEERTTYFYFENAFVGAYISCITGKPSEVSIEAMADCVLIVFPYAALAELFTKSIYWERFGRKLAEWALVGVEDRMVGLLTLSPEERYIQLLEGNKKKIIERIPQHLIANYLGITPVSLSRIRNRVMRK